MSIWAVTHSIGDTDWPPPDPGLVLTVPDTHTYPGQPWDVEATVDVSVIPAHCVPGHEATGEDSPALGGWVRLGVEHSDGGHLDVALDLAAAASLRDALTWWLDHHHIHPTPESPPCDSVEPRSAPRNRDVER